MTPPPPVVATAHIVIGQRPKFKSQEKHVTVVGGAFMCICACPPLQNMFSSAAELYPTEHKVNMGRVL